MSGRFPVLVGESNPYGSDAYFALYCEPPESSGGRLCRKIMGIPRFKYLEFPRYNLCYGEWSLPATRVEATRLPDTNTAVNHAYVLVHRVNAEELPDDGKLEVPDGS